MSTSPDFLPSPEQQEILEYELQPFRVVAGAGTGKTTTLAHRVAELMLRHQIEPEQVLGITFTNKAAHELAHRISSILGNSQADEPSRHPARQVNINTYHGFAHEILTTYGALVGVERDARIITPTVTRELLRRCIFDTDYQILDTTHLPTVTNNLINLESEMAANLVQPEHLIKNLSQLNLPEEEAVAKRSELAKTLNTYQETKKRMNLLDYGDLLSRAVQLVKEHPDILGRIRQAYRLVMLDEYQDTDPAQRTLFRLLFGEGSAVTAVGDPFQTIFEWRGASRFNFEAFPDDFTRSDGSPTQTLSLSVNRRSGRMILNLANQIRPRIKGQTRGKDLSPLASAGEAGVYVSWHPDFRTEAQAIVEQAQKEHDKGVRWADMAVLFRKNSDMESIRQALEAGNVPYQVADLGGLLQVPEVADIIAWLRILDDPEDDPALLRILLGGCFRLGIAELWPLSKWVQDQSRGGKFEPAATTLLESLDHLDELEITKTARTRLDEFRPLYQKLLIQAQSASLTELTRQVLTLTGAWHEVEALTPEAALTTRLNLYYFLDLTEQWSPLEGPQSLAGFLSHLRMLQEAPHEEPDVARIGEGNAVTLTTIHRAKGLEWEVVFLPTLYKGGFPSQPRVLMDPIRHHYTLPYDLIIDPGPRKELDHLSDPDGRKEILREKHYDQEWRLAYVAITRAKKSLYLSGAFWNDLADLPEPKKKPDPPSELLLEARDLEGSQELIWTDPAPERPESMPPPPWERPSSPDLGITWDEIMRQAIANPKWTEQRAQELGVGTQYDDAVRDMNEVLFSLPEPMEPTGDDSLLQTSVTSLVTYADCPKRFYWSEVSRLPRCPPGPAMQRGTELHRRIELFNRGAVPFDDFEDVAYDRTPDEEGSEEVPGNKKASGRKSGWDAFFGSRYASTSPAKVETPFELRIAQDALVRGRVDAVYEDDKGNWEIVDWKSGTPGSRPSALVQLQAYAVAAESECLGVPVPERFTVSFVFLGNGLQVVSHQADQIWRETARTRLQELLDGIRSEHFDPTPSDACHTCDFLNFCPEGQSQTQPLSI